MTVTQTSDSRFTLTPDGAWCFFADPRALYFAGRRRRTYAGWLTARGDVRIGVYDHDTGTVESTEIRAALQQDDHANPTLYLDAEGRITIFYSAHNGSVMYYRTSTLPEDISGFEEERQLPLNTEGRFGYTYPTPLYLAEERRLVLFWRGGNFKPNFSMNASPELAADAWSPVHTLIEDSGQRPYIRFAANGRDTIHFACTDGHPNIEPTNSIYYARYQDGAIRGADGASIKPMDELPLQLAEIDVVFDGRAAGRGAWIWDIAEDALGYPVVVYAVFETTTDHRYWYSRWDGKQWVSGEITPAGGWFPQTPEGVVEREPYYSGGLALDHADPSVVYLSRPVNGVFEIERWETPDLGRTWSSAPVTSGSDRHQVRPFLTRGAPKGEAVLFWMSGDYVHFTNYRTAIMAAAPALME